jgi:hypothetical protein
MTLNEFLDRWFEQQQSRNCVKRVTEVMRACSGATSDRTSAKEYFRVSALLMCRAHTSI